MEEYIKGLSADPDLVVSDAAKERYRLLKGRCIEKANSDIVAAKDEIVIRELDRQNKAAAEELKKAAAFEEVQEMEDPPQATAADTKPKNTAAGKPMHTTPNAERHSGSTAGNSKPKKERGGKKKKDGTTKDQRAKGKAADDKAKG
ncbi:unnamed protein product [Closterium sp. Naga37s-1]|nr:unnamed protein product [Closterium sp. Naga37s-1]